MTTNQRMAVVAVGGNSLITDKAHQLIPDQYRSAAMTAGYIADMVATGWNVVLTHGNGPQVGFIMRRSELSIHEVPPVPMDYAGADIQGAIGYMFDRAFRNEFRRRGIDRNPKGRVLNISAAAQEGRVDKSAACRVELRDECVRRARARRLIRSLIGPRRRGKIA